MTEEKILELAEANKQAEINRLKKEGIKKEDIEARVGQMDFEAGVRETAKQAAKAERKEKFRKEFLKTKMTKEQKAAVENLFEVIDAKEARGERFPDDLRAIVSLIQTII